MARNSSTVQIKEIAQRAGMSPSTVSIVLSGRGDEMRISKATQAKIRKIAREMDYAPNIYARRLRGNQDAGCGILIAVFWNQKILDGEMANFLLGAETVNRQKGYHAEFVVRMYEEDKLSEHTELFDSHSYSGIIVNGASQADVDFLEKLPADIPVVLTSRIGSRISSVYVDNYELGRECARLFSEAGYQKAGIISTYRPSIGSRLRIMGFKDGAREFGLENRSEWEIASDEFSVETNMADCRKLLALSDRPDCLFVQRSVMTIGIQGVLRTEGIKIPEEIAILGCGLQPFLAANSPSISMVGGSMRSFGQASVDLLMLLINNHVTTPMHTVTQPIYSFHDSFRPKS